jgi:hypothetical protein
MRIRLVVSLVLALAAWSALPQDTPAPIQTAQADEKPPAVEEPAVVLPETGHTKELLIGAAVLGLVLLGIHPAESCFDSSDCGASPITTTTGTR